MVITSVITFGTIKNIKMKKGKVTKVKWNSSKREDWLKQRSEVMGDNSLDICRIGSSEVSTVLGIGFGSPYVLFQKKCGLTHFDKKSFKMSMGQRMEGYIAESLESYSTDPVEFAENFDSGLRVRRLSKARYFLLNSEYDHLIASLDYTMSKKYPDIFTGEFLKTDVDVECKNPNFLNYKSWGGKVPEYYNVQVQQQLLVSGLSKAYLAVIAGSDVFDVFEVLPDLELQKYISNKCLEFSLGVVKAKMIVNLINDELKKQAPDQSFIQDLWGMVYDMMPPADGSEDLQEYLEDDLYPNTNGLEMIGDDVDLIHVKKYLKATSLEGKLKSYKREIRNNLTLRMEDFEIMKVGDHRVVNRRSELSRNYFSIK